LALYDLSASILKPTTTTETALVSNQLGVSRLRLLPKISGVRPLMNLSGKSLDMDISVNRSLELVHRALLFEIDRQSDRLLGSTVRNVDEIHAKLKNLASRIQACPRCAHVEGRKLYCVTVDVERCFDTIRPKKLLRVLKKVFAEEEYLVRKHWVCKGAYYKMERPAFPSGDLKGYDQLVQDIAKKKDAVFVDGVLYDYISKAKILTLLREHLTANTVQANDQLYTQRQGIPQGSVLSTTLCNLYYAHFEKRVLQKQMQAMVSSQTEIVDCSHELIMRYTDDYLFVSTDQERAREFAQLMHRGNHDYGCFVNLKKSRVNFPVLVVDADGEMREIPRVDQPSDADATAPLLAWCGLLLDPDSLQVYANYDK
jgi:telomerase reverse transcriptase